MKNHCFNCETPTNCHAMNECIKGEGICAPPCSLRTVGDCEHCGGEMEVKDPFYDGDTATCSDCQQQQAVTVYEDGDYSLQENEREQP